MEDLGNSAESRLAPTSGTQSQEVGSRAQQELEAWVVAFGRPIFLSDLATLSLLARLEWDWDVDRELGTEKSQTGPGALTGFPWNPYKVN